MIVIVKKHIKKVKHKKRWSQVLFLTREFMQIYVPNEI